MPQSPLQTDPQTLILGAGPCGLATAWELGLLGRGCLLVDRNAEPGGLCRTFVHGRYRSDLSIHRFQIAEQELWARLQALFAGQLHRVDHKWIHIDVDGKRLVYPLNPLSLLRLPLPRLMRAGVDYLRQRWAAAEAGDQGAEHYRGWFEGQYGAELYRWIAGPLMEKQWGVPGTGLSATFASHRRVSAGVGDLLAELPLLGRLWRRQIPPDFVYGKQGIGPLMARLLAAAEAGGARFVGGQAVKAIRHRKARVQAVELSDGSELPCADLVSTIPLPALLSAMDPSAPPPLLKRLKSLKFRNLVVVALVLRRSRVSVDHVTYFPAPDVPFTRTFEPKNASPTMVPAGRTVLGFEIPCFADDTTWRQDDAELMDAMARFGPRVGFDPSEVEDGWVIRVPEAYPLYEAGYQDTVARTLRWLHGELRNLYLVGRNSLFRLDNMGHAMTMGIDLARHLAGQGTPRQWHHSLQRYDSFSYID